MKVKVVTYSETEIEVDSPAIAELDKFWRIPGNKKPSDDIVDEAIKAVEDATGLPFGNDSAPVCISAVLAMDGEPILEW